MRQNAKWLYAIWGDATLSRLVRQTVDMLHLSMLMEVCVLRPGSGSKQLPSAGRAGLYLTLSITTAAKCGSPVWVNMQNHFSRRRFSPGFLFFSFFSPLPVLFGRRLPLAVSYCMLSRIITNLNMAHAASPRGIPLSSRTPNGTRMFCEPPSEKAGPLWCTPIRETEKMMCGNVHEGR